MPASSPALAAVPAPPARGPARERQSRLYALDGLRLLAALMVCLYHYAGRGGPVSGSWHQSPAQVFPTLSQAATYGCLGVQFFFVISGFVICMSSWGRTLGDFFRSRVARLYPAYWAALVLVTAAAVALPVVVHPVRPDEFLVNLTMLQQPMGADRVLGVCWTLWVEVRFYALFALCVVLRGVTYRRVVLFACVWTLAAVVCRTSGNALIEQLVMPEYAPFFIGGLALYLIHRFGGDLLLWGIVAVSWLLGQSTATTGLWHPGAQGDFHRDPYVILAIVTVAFASVAAVAVGWTRWASWRWLVTAGALTYPFYLVHEHLGWFVIRVLHRGLGLPPWPTLAATVLGMLALAWLLYRFVEKPFGPRLKRALKKARTPGTSAGALS
ncbi:MULTISPECIES: acyltransferase family protein [Streptomyces]|uniref:Acyltransferase n=1 Tax=Streptomyces tricolor TaxID=68277 RepID=A0ABS9JP00_9ACTN|nr:MULTISPECIES: acyltransferase [Streptomyces]MCG0067299.1 acyltransferase [Streptomyces tricolor]BCM69052.1 putative membrane protein [Streptomyces sp. EAS-AB2608]CUW30682.1 Acyltransferase family protein [Streptomyces reticuli]